MSSVSSKRRYFCRVLGLAPTASRNQVRQAYRRLAKKWHPDRNPDHPEAERRFHEIHEAYRALTSPEDRQGSTTDRDTAGSWQDAHRRERDPAAEHFFQRNGLDVVCDIPVTVPEAVLGFTLEMPTLRERRLRLRIPPGVRDGTTFRVPGRGAVEGNERGDQLARVRIAFPADPGPDPERLLWEARGLGEEWPEEVRRVALAVGRAGGRWAPEASRGIIEKLSDRCRPAILANLHPDDREMDELFRATDRPGFRALPEGLADLQKIAFRPDHETFAYLPMGRRDDRWQARRDRLEGGLVQHLLNSRVLQSVAEGIRHKGGILLLYLPARFGRMVGDSEVADAWIGLGTGAMERPKWKTMRTLGRIPRLSSGRRVTPNRRWAPVTFDEPVNALSTRQHSTKRFSTGSRTRSDPRTSRRASFPVRALLVVAGITLSMLAGWLLAQVG